MKRAGARAQAGLTLLEVLIAMTILAVITVGAQQALDIAVRSSEVSQEKLKEIEKLDRTWLLIENDLKNVLAYTKKPEFEEPIPAMSLSYDDDAFLTFIRGGLANPLFFPRSEVIRVSYRLEDNTLWRYSWIDAANLDEDFAKKQRLISDVEAVTVRALGPKSRSVSAGPWVEEWADVSLPGKIPAALEITMDTASRGELKRLFSLPTGR